MQPDKTIELADLAGQINLEHAAAISAAGKAFEHMIACGEHLLAARHRVPHGQWLDWLKENTDVCVSVSYDYMKAAKNKDMLRKYLPASAVQARKLCSQLGVGVGPRIDPRSMADMERLRNDGMTYQEIAAQLDMKMTTVYRWLNLDTISEKRAARKQLTVAARRREKAAQRAAAVKAKGGEVAKAYALVRKALDALQRCDDESDHEARSCISTAMTRLYDAEDNLVRACRVGRKRDRTSLQKR